MLDALLDPGFQLLDVILDQLQELELLAHAAGGLGRQVSMSLSSGGRHLGVKISLAVSRERAYLARVECMRFLRLSPGLGESHPGAGQFTLVADVVGWDPDRGELAQVEQGGQALGVELVGLVDVAHHDLGLGGVSQERDAAGVFDLVDDPVPVADGLKGHGCPFGELLQKLRIAPGTWPTRVRWTRSPLWSRTAKSEKCL